MYFVSCLWMWSFSWSTISNNVYFCILKLCIQHSLSYSIIRNIGNHVINLNLTQWSSFLQNKLVFGCKQRRWRYIEIQTMYQLVTTMKLGWKLEKGNKSNICNKITKTQKDMLWQHHFRQPLMKKSWLNNAREKHKIQWIST